MHVYEYITTIYEFVRSSLSLNELLDVAPASFHWETFGLLNEFIYYVFWFTHPAQTPAGINWTSYGTAPLLPPKFYNDVIQFPIKKILKEAIHQSPWAYPNNTISVD